MASSPTHGPAAVAAPAPASLHHLDACTGLYDLTTDQLQGKLSQLVGSVSSGGAVSLDEFMLIEKQILLIHQELRERHLSAALAHDPWMDSELDDVHVGQRDRQADEAAREAAEVDRQLEDIREDGRQDRRKPDGAVRPAPIDAAEQHWANRGSDRRGLDEARRRAAETGAVRTMAPIQHYSSLSGHRKKPAAPKTKSSASAMSIPDNILNQRREMVIMTSSVDNRRMNKPAAKADGKKTKSATMASPPLSPGSSPPSSKRSVTRDTSFPVAGGHKRSSSTGSKANSKAPQLSANQKAKLYADAHKQETKAKIGSKTTTAGISLSSTAASSPRTTVSDGSDVSSALDSIGTGRPDSTASTVINDSPVESPTDTDRPSDNLDDATMQTSFDPRGLSAPPQQMELRHDDDELQLDDDGDDYASDDEHQLQPHAHSTGLPLPLRSPPAHAYASMDHAAIEAALSARHLDSRSLAETSSLPTTAAFSYPAATTHASSSSSSSSSIPLSAAADDDDSFHEIFESLPDESHEPDASPAAADISPRAADTYHSSVLSIPLAAASDDGYSDSPLSDSEDEFADPSSPPPVADAISAAEWAAASAAGDNVLQALKRKQTRLASISSSTAAVNAAVKASRVRVARSNPRKEAERAVARLARTREDQRTQIGEEREPTKKSREVPPRTVLTKSTSKDDTPSSTASSSLAPSVSSTALVIPPKPKRPAKPPMRTAAYETVLPSLEHMFSAMWSAASASGTATGQNWFAALVSHIAQCEKFKLAFGLPPSAPRPQRTGSAHARNRLVGVSASERATGLAADELRLEYLTATIQAGGPSASLAAKQKLNHAETKALEQSRLLKAQRVHQQNLLASSDDHLTADPDEIEDDEVLARDHGPNNNSSALIFLVTHEREEVYTVVRQALLALKDDDEEDPDFTEFKTTGTETKTREAPRVWIECPMEDAPKPDRLFPFLPPNFTSAAIGSAPAHATPAPPTPLYANPPSAAHHNHSSSATMLAPQAGVEFSSNGGQFHELSSGIPGVPSARGTPSLYWNLLWTWKKPHIDYSKLFAWQKVNHYPDSRCLTRKDLLKKQIERYSLHRGYKHRAEWNIMPQSFILPQEYQAFIDCFSRQAIEAQEAIQANPHNPPLKSLNYWICKPPSLSRGRGIFVTDNLDEIDYKEPLIIQRYVLNPLLLRGYKFDLRLYVVVTSIQPLEVFLYREGFARISTTKFSTAAADLKNKFIHLTNSSVQKNNILSRDGKEIGGAGAEPAAAAPRVNSAKINRTGDARFDNPAGLGSSAPAPKQTLTDPIFHDPAGDGGSKISLAYLWSHLRSTGVNTDDLWAKIVRVVLKTLVAVEDDITPCVNSFEMFGFDILISDDLEAHLVEVNASPSMGLDTPLDQLLKPRLIRDIVGLVAPLRTHHYFLQQVLERRFKSGYFERTVPKSREKKVQSQNELLHLILEGEKPRVVGEMPKTLGLFERIAPLTPAFDAIMKMKRSAFQPTTNVDHKYKRTLPPMV